MDINQFCDEVEAITRRELGDDGIDGGNLCFNLIETGAINMKNGVAVAARITVQHIAQA